MLSSPRRRSTRDDGQATAEYLGLVVVVGVVVGAIAGSSLGGQLTGLLSQAVCAVGGGPCTTEVAVQDSPEEACVPGSAEGQGTPALQSTTVDLGEGRTARISERSDGTVAVTELAGDEEPPGARGPDAGAGLASVPQESGPTMVYPDREAAARAMADRLEEIGIDMRPIGAPPKSFFAEDTQDSGTGAGGSC